jgi:hypothetical protein
VLRKLVRGIATPARAGSGALGGVLAADAVRLGVGALASSAVTTRHSVPSGFGHFVLCFKKYSELLFAMQLRKPA